MIRYHIDQLALPIPVPPRVEPDYEADAREDLTEALAIAKAAVDRPPWDYRKHRYWRIVFPQMSGWLPEEERRPMVAEFLGEWNRITSLFPDGEREALEAYGRERDAGDQLREGEPTHA